MIIEDRIYDVECDCCHKSMNIFPIFLISDAEEIARDKFGNNYLIDDVIVTEM